MEKRNKIIIIGLIIVIIALVGITLYMFNGQHQQSSTQIKVTGNKTIEEGGTLNVKLSLLNGTGVKNKKINITITDKKNKKVLKKTVKTKSNGKASVDLGNISKGNYVVNITFEGDKNYSANTTSQKIKIIEKKVAETTPQTTSEATQTAESTQQNEAETNDLGLSQHSANDWRYKGSVNGIEYYTSNGDDELVLYDNGAYEYLDGHGHGVGGLIE